MLPLDLTQITEEKQETHILTTATPTEKQDIACNCVAYARTFRPDIPLKNASDFVPATTTPYAGAIALMHYPSGAWHLAYVAIVENGRVFLRHANVEHCKETVEWMDAKNSRIQGYF
jgi:hypothetical protein